MSETKIICPGSTDKGKLFIVVQLTNPNTDEARLHIDVFEGPMPSGKCRGGAGLIVNGFLCLDRLQRYQPEWDKESVDELIDMWNSGEFFYSGFRTGRDRIFYMLNLLPNDSPSNYYTVCDSTIQWFNNLPETKLTLSPACFAVARMNRSTPPLYPRYVWDDDHGIAGL